MTHFIIGAHSRDKEIKELQVELVKQKEYTKRLQRVFEFLKINFTLSDVSIKN